MRELRRSGKPERPNRERITLTRGKTLPCRSGASAPGEVLKSANAGKECGPAVACGANGDGPAKTVNEHRTATR